MGQALCYTYLWPFSYLIYSGGKPGYAHFTDQEVEAQRSEVMSKGYNTANQRQSQDPDLGATFSRACILSIILCFEKKKNRASPLNCEGMRLIWKRCSFLVLLKRLSGSAAPSVYLLLSLQLEIMEVTLKPMSHEARVNQVVTQWPLAACQDALSWFQDTATYWPSGMELGGLTFINLSSSPTQQPYLEPYILVYLKQKPESLGSSWKRLDSPCCDQFSP